VIGPLLTLLAATGLAAEPVPTEPTGHAAEPRVMHLADALQAAATHPAVRAAEATAEGAAARADEARGALLPQVDGRASWDHTFGEGAAWAGSVGLEQTIFDFGATPNSWAAARRTAAAGRLDTEEVQVAVALAVRHAWFAAVAAKALVGVAAEALANEERHLGQVEAFVEIGTRAPIDLAKARTDRANARVALLRAQGAYEQAKAALDQAMGVEGPLDFDVADEPFPAVDGEDRPTESLLDEALASRPDAAALTERMAAQRARVHAATGAYGPALSFGATAGASGARLDGLGPSVGVGLDLAVPIFDGGVLHAQAHEARAELAVLEAEADTLRQQARVEIETARLAVATEKAALEAADEAVEAARQQLGLAQGRYETGVGNAIELGDAQLARTNAEGQRVSAAYDLAAARAELLAALGRPAW
jgi:outer membrane protein